MSDHAKTFFHRLATDSWKKIERFLVSKRLETVHQVSEFCV